MTRGRFRSKVLALAVIPAVIMTASLILFFTSVRLSEVDAELSARGQAISRQLAPACEYGVFSNNKQVLTRLAQAALREADVIAVTIRTNTGDVLVDARNQVRDTDESDGSKETARVFHAPIIASEIEIDDYAVFEPMLRSSKSDSAKPPLGRVEVELSEAAMLAQQWTILAQSLLFGLVGLMLTSLLAIRAARSVSVPVLQLAEAVEKIKNGQLETLVTTRSGGELGTLERGVHDMATALRQARDEAIGRAEDTLFLEKVRAQVTLQSLGEGVLSTDAQGRITFLNTAAEQLLGWTCGQALGMPLPIVVHTDDDASLLSCLTVGSVIRCEGYRRLFRRDGTGISVRDSAAPVRDRDGIIIGMVLVLHDVTQMYSLTEQLAFQASHDSLTGLLNRSAFEARLQQVTEHARTDNQRHVLCYVDLDQFKVVNDTSGHAAGDELLKQLTMILRVRLRHGDTIGRLGGDEFGVIFENCTISEAQPIAETLRASISAFRFGWEGHVFDVGASVGMVEIDSDSGNLQDLMRAADSACYVAKDLGRNRIHIYRPDDSALAKRRGEMQWARRLKLCIDENRLILFAQEIRPLSNLYLGHAPEFEITVMMCGEAGTEPTPPMAFIPAAERYNLMPNLDRWVIGTAFRYLQDVTQAAHRCGLRAPNFAINLSGQSLSDPNFLSFVVEKLQIASISPKQICFEVTETAAIANFNSAVELLLALRGLGCRVALDDFGSGLSSFGYLKQLPIDLVKIDGAFVKDIACDQVSLSMVEAINHIGHVMGLSTVAECVESAAILAKLEEIGVDFAQGFFLDRPRPVEELLTIGTISRLFPKSQAHLHGFESGKSATDRLSVDRLEPL